MLESPSQSRARSERCGAPLCPAASRSSTRTFLCCWHLWKHRNGVVFNEQQPCLSNILRSCREDARLWASRLPRADAPIVESWCNLLSPV
uniref:Uncharacterized protein n=1 Tax=Setaria viridis TaxID=4556 RepID=A0A4U6T3U9_SETVI|nr:hypothetical protein SEVIR_9G420050v2 [Setaria viridis]